MDRSNVTIAKVFFWIYIFCAFNVASQKEALEWRFGVKAGLSFSVDPPAVVANSAMSAREACTSISDANGKLLFYSWGDTVWNIQNAVMANGTGLLGHWSTTQGVLAVNEPGSKSIYYLFTLDQAGGPNGLRYSIIDMNLSAGNGSVTIKNVPVYSPSTEKLAAVGHCNGTDYWIVSHEVNTNNFRSYLLTSSGLNSSPVISSIGAVHGTMNTSRQMKFSPTGRKLAIIIPVPGVQKSSVVLFDFNNSTGVISNQITLASDFTSAYGCEFSADGTKLYATTSGPRALHQWDLCAGDSTAIVASAYTIATHPNTANSALQLAPNNRIYLSKSNQTSLGVINKPDLAGAACDFADLSQTLGSSVAKEGLPSFAASIFKPSVSFNQGLACTTVTFTPPAFADPQSPNCAAVANSVSGLLWNFGDPGSGSANTSTLGNPVHTYPSYGTYTAQLVISYASCAPDTIRQVVTVATPSISFSQATVSCDGLGTATVNINGTSGPFTYSWLPSAATTSVAAGLAPGIHTVHISAGGCSATRTLMVVAPVTISATTNVTVACTTATGAITLSNGSGNYQYLWSPASQTAAIVSGLTSGIYTITVTDIDNACSLSRTLQVSIPPTPTIDVTGNFSICAGENTIIMAGGADTFSWSSGQQTASISLSPGSTTVYSVTGTFTASGCTGVTTITVNVAPCIGIDEVHNAGRVKIFPNPASNQIQISSARQNETIQVLILDAIGRVIYEDSVQVELHEAKINVSLNNGIYFMTFMNESRITCTRKLIIAH